MAVQQRSGVEDILNDPIQRPRPRSKVVAGLVHPRLARLVPGSNHGKNRAEVSRLVGPDVVEDVTLWVLAELVALGLLEDADAA